MFANVAAIQRGGVAVSVQSRHDYNLDEAVDYLIGIALKLQNVTKLSHQMWACGSDFQCE